MPAGGQCVPTIPGQMRAVASKPKARVGSWGTFYIDQTTLLKSRGPDTVVKLCDDRGLNNSIPDRGQKKNKLNLKKKSQSHQDKLSHTVPESEGKQV